MSADERRFPLLQDGVHMQAARVLGWPPSIPWSVVEPHGRQALKNHSQTLERLAERGGLAPSELMAVLEDRPWHSMKLEVSVPRALAVVAWAERLARIGPIVLHKVKVKVDEGETSSLGFDIEAELTKWLASAGPKIPFTDNGIAQIIAAAEASGRFVPGSVSFDPETKLLEGTLVGGILNTSIDVTVKI